MSIEKLQPLGTLRVLEQEAPSAPGLTDLPQELARVLDGLSLLAGSLRDKRIAVAIGSRGIASIDILTRQLCGWLKTQGARPFIFPAMGSHGGATAEGQRRVLEQYGVTAEFLGVELLSSMETTCLGATPEGFRSSWIASPGKPMPWYC
jgi:hypothetical protein